MNSHMGRDRKKNLGTGLRTKLRVGLAAGMLTLFAGHLHAAPGVLAQTPLFLVNPVQPNIFFLLDDSGSMDWEVLRRNDGGGSGNLDFTPDDATERLEHCHGFNALAYDPTTWPDKPYSPWYGADVDGNDFVDSSPTSARVNPYTGDASTGGCDNNGIVINNNGVTCDLVNGFGGNGAFYYEWSDSNNNGRYDNGECDTATQNFVSAMTAGERINYANWFSYYRKREYVMKRAVSELAHESTERMGFATINRNNHITKNTEVGTQVKDVDDLTVPINATSAANKATLLDNLLGVNSSSSTPLRLGLEHTGQYFMNQMNNSDLFGYTPVAQTDSAEGSSPILTEELGGTCQQNFAIVMSDGFWNGGDPATGNTDTDGAGDFDGQSYADDVGGTLADVAMRFYETDLSATLANEVPVVSILVSPGDEAECDAVTQDEAALHPNCFDTNNQQHLVTYTVAFGVRGTIPENVGATTTPCLPMRGSSVTTQNWPRSCDGSLAAGWPTPVGNANTTVDDMLHAAWNGRGIFLSAKDPDELIEALRDAINDISSKSSVAAAAVAVDSSSIIGGGNVVQGKFNPSDWTGELYSYTVAAGGAVSATPSWAAHELLDARGYSTRNAVTFNGTVGIPFTFPANYTDASALGVTEISQRQLNDLMFNAPFPIGTAVTAEQDANRVYGENLVAYLRGDASHTQGINGFRDRSGHKLGDIVHSAPRYVGDPDPTRYYDSSYQLWAGSAAPTGAKGRREMIYVGANDGALHAFYADTGEEAFAYFPQAVFNNEAQWGLHFLADKDYEHRYYVDGEVTVAEVYSDLDGSGAQWRTILIGTLRGGGRAVYAIDISDPSEFATPSGVASNILWEFSDDELGFTYGKATVAKLNNGRWAAIFGNGYLPGSAATGAASLFIVYLDRTAASSVPEHITISTNVGSNTAAGCLDSTSDCNGLSTPAVVDLGGDNIADRVYAGDLKGNLWAFDLSSATASSWGLAYGAQPLFTAKTATTAAQQITTQPAVILHPTERHSNTSPNTLIYFGTGQYITKTDPIATTANTFYGIWDSGSAISSARDDALVEQTITQTVLGGRDIRVMTNNPVDYSTDRGWFVDLPDTGERVVSNPIVFGDIVVYNSIVPEATQSNICNSSGGSSWLMVHSLVDGSEPDFIALDVTGDGAFDDEDQKDGKNVTGVRSGTLNWQITISKSGPGAEGIAFIPAEDLDTVKIRGGRSVGTRSSWGRFIIE